MRAAVKEKINRKNLPPKYSFNFAPVCMMHLRNLRITMIRAIDGKSGDYSYRDFAMLGLPVLDKLISDGKFDNLPETI